MSDVQDSDSDFDPNEPSPAVRFYLFYYDV